MYFSTGRFCIFHHFYGTLKGAGLFQRACQTMKQAGGRGTSRYPIGIKSWPELISSWILMRIFFCHLISHLWRKMAIVWAIFGMIFRLFIVSDAFMLKKGAHSTWIYLTHVRSRIQAILGPLSHKSMAGRRQKWSILDQKWPSMAGLSTFQSGPKGSKRVQNGQPKCFWPFGTLLGPSGPFWAISNKNWFFAPKHLCHTHLGQKIHFCLKWSKRAQMVKNT